VFTPAVLRLKWQTPFDRPVYGYTESSATHPSCFAATCDSTKHKQQSHRFRCCREPRALKSHKKRSDLQHTIVHFAALRARVDAAQRAIHLRKMHD
jgi:hypothetical protein